MAGTAPTPPRETLRRTSYNRTQSGELRWANDNFNLQQHGDISPPLPAALTSRPFPRSIPLCAEEESHPARQTRTHQRSLSDLLPQFPTPSLSNPASPNRSPIKEISKEEFEDEFMPTLTGDKGGIVKVADKPRGGGGLSSWFTGASAPVPLGLPVAMEQTPLSPTTKSQKRQTMESNPSVPATPASATSVFGGFFSSPKQKSPTTLQVRTPSSTNDEYLTLDISKALFPSGQPDPFSPSAFKNLLMNAEGTLLKLQTAYKLCTIALHELVAEKEAQAEEHEGLEIRAQSLKSQLEEMSQQLALKDAAMAELAERLAREKELRAEEALAREKSITLIKTQAQAASEYALQQAAHKDAAIPTLTDSLAKERGMHFVPETLTKTLALRTTGGSAPRRPTREEDISDSEDLGFSSTTPTTRSSNPNSWRASYGSTDISEEDDDEEEDEEPPAVFSRSMSPTASLSTAHTSISYAATDTTGTDTDSLSPSLSRNDSRTEFHEASIAVVVQNPKVSAFSPQLVQPKQQQSTFQKVLARSLRGGTSPSGCEAKETQQNQNHNQKLDIRGLGEMECSNCQGGDARSAWDTVGVLKAENKGLKERLGRLEEGLDGALDAVLGFGYAPR